MFSKFQVGLKSLLRQGLSEPDFYGDLVYKLKKSVGSYNFSGQFIKIISHYKKIGCNINVLQQAACLVVIPITVGNFAFLFKTLWWFRLKDLCFDEMVGAHRGLPFGLFFLLRYSVLFTVESLSLLYLLVVSWFICFRRWCIDKLGVFHANQISIVCVLFHIWIMGEVGAVKLV